MITIEQIVNLFNHSFETGIVPSQWKEGIIVPIIKPNKDKTKISSYRPITLSCLGKLMKRVISKRLEYCIRSANILSNSQCGFRKGQGTIDVLLRIENEIRRAQTTGGICLVVYIDLEGAFYKI